jgi:hypothetical protein
MSNKIDVLAVEFVSERLSEVVSKDYVWPVVPEGYQLEFLLHPDGTIILDFLNTETGCFWSEFVDMEIETPYTTDNNPIAWQHLESLGIPFMS